MPMPKKPLGSFKFGRLMVIADVKGGWLCRCECGKFIIATGSNLRSGNTTSCGCFRVERLLAVLQIHGMKHSRTYSIWCNMIQRCANQISPDFKNYGGRGIFVCERWKNFSNFIFDLGECPADLTIERNDNKKGYEPGNCRWATRTEQARNKSTSRVFVIDGAQKCLAEWCEIYGVPYWTAHSRLRRGWSIDKALGGPS